MLGLIALLESINKPQIYITLPKIYTEAAILRALFDNVPFWKVAYDLF